MPMLVRLLCAALAALACAGLAGCTAQDTECLARIGRKLVERSHGAADTVRTVADGLPEQWDSPGSTDAVREHLYRYADALDTSASRAHTALSTG